MFVLVLIALTIIISIISFAYAQSNSEVSIVQDASTLGDKTYNPNPITISQGDTVTGINTDFGIHTVTENNDIFSSDDLRPDQNFNTCSINRVLLIIIANYIPL